MEGKLQVWKVIFWRCGYIGLLPLKGCKDSKRNTKGLAHRFGIPKLVPFDLPLRLLWVPTRGCITRVLFLQLDGRLHERPLAQLPKEPRAIRSTKYYSPEGLSYIESRIVDLLRNVSNGGDPVAIESREDFLEVSFVSTCLTWED